MPRTLLLLLASLVLLCGCDRMGSVERIDPEDRLPLLLPRLPVGERPAAGAADGPRTTVLENGLTVLVQRDARFPLASLRLYVRAGSGWETPREAGLSHLLEHMVFKGTRRLGPGEAARAIEAAGGEFNAGTSFDYTVYYADMPAANWRLGLDVIQDMALHATVDAAELENERKVVVSELEMGEDDPGRRQFKALQEMVWPGTSYAWPIIGTRESLAGITRDDILDYVRRRYQPRNMLLLAVGDVREEAVLAEARRHFGALRNSGASQAADELPLPLFAGPAVRVEHGKWNKAYVTLAFPVPGLRREQAVGLDLLAQILGGDATSRLYRTWKYEKRLVDQISAECMTLERGGGFVIQATLDADKVAAFTAGLAADLAALDPAAFTAEELARAKLNIEEQLFRSKETLGGLANKLGWFAFFENGQVSEDNYLFALRGAGQAVLADVAREYLRPGRLAGIYLLPDGTKADAAGLAEAVERAWPARAEEAASSVSAAAGDGGAAGRTPAEVVPVHGVPVALLPDPTMPYTSIEISWPGGSSLDATVTDGLADFTAAYLSKGAGGMDYLTRQVFLSDRAASLGAASRRDAFTVSARFPTRFTADILPLVEATILAPDFPEAELGRVRQEQLAAIKRREDRPLGLAFRRLFPFLFSGPGYGSLILGDPASVEGLTPRQARGFWQRQRGLPLSIAVCGDFDRDAVLALARRLRGGTGQAADVTPAVPVWKEEREAVEHLPGRNQVHLLKVFPAPGLTDPDSPALAVLKEVLSGQSGLLFRELRDKQGLGYSVTAMLWQTPGAGFIAFYIGTEPDKAGQALAGFDAAIEGLRAAELSAEEVRRAVNILQGDYWRERQSISSRAGEAASLMTMGLPLDFARRQVEAAGAVTPGEIKALAARILRPEEARLLRVEP